MSYGNGFTLDFVYCKNCHFWVNQTHYQQFDADMPITSQKKQLQDIFEQQHDTEFPFCKNRNLIISYNRVMVENAE